MAERLTEARAAIDTRIPESYRDRYMHVLLLDKLPQKKIKPTNLFSLLLNVRDMKDPEIDPDSIVIQRLGKNFTAYLPGNTTILIVHDGNDLKLEILGNAFISLPLYQTLSHNLSILKHDVELFDKMRKNGNLKQES
jgi:hypothetical protein